MKTDPTKTIILRQRAEKEIRRRFGNVKRAAVSAILRGKLITNVSLARDGEFEFTRDTDKIPEFERFLQDRIDDELLRIEGLSVVERNLEDYWLNRYIGEGYRRGAVKTRLAAERAIPGMLKLPDFNPFTNPNHVERAEIIYQRVYSDLEGITQTMSKQISRELASGIIEGKNPKVVADAIAERVDKIGITRARLLARTEIVESHNSASIREGETLAAETGVKIKMLWISAGDRRVRPEHADRDGNLYSMSEAQSLIGEPNCRCSISPDFDI